MALFSRLVRLQQRQGNWRHSGSNIREGHTVSRQNAQSQNVRWVMAVSFRNGSQMHRPLRSYPSNNANRCWSCSYGLNPPLGYCIRRPSSTVKGGSDGVTPYLKGSFSSGVPPLKIAVLTKETPTFTAWEYKLELKQEERKSLCPIVKRMIQVKCKFHSIMTPSCLSSKKL